MSLWHLKLKTQPGLRLDLRSINPSTLAQLSQREIEQLPLPSGNRLTPLGEWFSVQPLEAHGTDLLIEGDLSKVDRIGWQLAGGHVRVQGPVGDYVGAAMSGGHLTVHGSAGALVACEMAGGHLTVNGNVGDFAASTLPGSMDGMRGGQLVVHGDAGARLADRMRRGTVVVHGSVGDFAASRMVAGTVAIAGGCGAHPAWGMRRGSLVMATRDEQQRPQPSATFVPAVADAAVFWQLLSRDLAQHGGAFAGLPTRPIRRWLGDLATDGKGEMIFPQ
ncbi:MAG: formylmethanofuran dehydrogenase subunit C [Vitreoscilla sp.]|nr:formylmethanofuran dehydrogenase subunit C [Burkholderiales bacterium]MBP6336478.1 formylmethanofuran dehydrogenase subunit C [Vitreoscilla sp.]MBP6677424.1 formylmethanofuran dehydrogenase subunit C [Vitreoscilla sp.]